MKSLFVAAIFVFSAIGAFAQVPHVPMGPGTWMGNVQGSFSSLSGGGSDVEITNLDLMAGFFVSEHVAIGGGLSWADIDGSDATAITVGLNYYFTDPDAQVPVYLGGRYYHLDVTGFDANGWSAELGAHFFVAENVSVDPFISFGQLEDVDIFSVGFGLSIWFSSR
ncbi:MAG: hypothetical protein KatS3mg015_0666 [Fimbriimonadales bacterium]|nr:MAG: hypothetical protein KatS3mg015_0666 [Fimbriimonadales bacterium]